MTTVLNGDDLARARARRWWLTRKRLGTVERAGAFICDVGFALLFPAERVQLPSLWEVIAGDEAEPFAGGWGTAEDRVWTWKDELPRRGLAWYGRFLNGRASLLAPGLLAALYPGEGETDDHARLELSADAHRVADALKAGPLTSAALRVVVGRRAYSRAIAELQRHLLVTTAGVREQRSGWPSAVVELTCRQFQLEGPQNRTAAAGCYLDTVLSAGAAELARAFGWPRREASVQLDSLVVSGRAERDGALYGRRTVVGPVRDDGEASTHPDR